MSTTAQCDITELLQQAGAIPPRCGRGKWTCPDCGEAALAVNAQKQLFNCFHYGCEFKGGIGFLRKRLGMGHEWLPKCEYVRKARQSERSQDAARRLYAKVHSRRMWLLDVLREVATIERLANELGPDHQATWAALDLVNNFRPELMAELAALENANAPEVFRFIAETDETRQAVLDRILARGGLNDTEGRFVEVGA